MNKFVTWRGSAYEKVKPLVMGMCNGCDVNFNIWKKEPESPCSDCIHNFEQDEYILKEIKSPQAGVILDKTPGLTIGPGQVPPNRIPPMTILPEPTKTPSEVRSHNVGTSNYAQHKIQPWDIWLEYDLNPWDADIVKRVLRQKAGDSRELDYRKIIHICEERIRQIQEKESK